MSKNGAPRKIFVSEGVERSKEHATLLYVCVCVCVFVCVRERETEREKFLKFKFHKICDNVCGLLFYRCTCRAPSVHLIPPPNIS